MSEIFDHMNLVIFIGTFLFATFFFHGIHTVTDSHEEPIISVDNVEKTLKICEDAARIAKIRCFTSAENILYHGNASQDELVLRYLHGILFFISMVIVFMYVYQIDKTSESLLYKIFHTALIILMLLLLLFFNMAVSYVGFRLDIMMGK